MLNATETRQRRAFLDSLRRSNFERAIAILLRDFNPNHAPAGSSEGGQFTSGSGGGGSPAKSQGRGEGKTLGHGYSKSAKLKGGKIYTDNVYDATRALYEGRDVVLNQAREASTLIDHLGKVATEMVRLGGKAPTFDLCHVSVPGTNLFCAESKGIPRIKMPQLDEKQTKAFVDALKKEGYKVDKTTELPSKLKATQNQLIGDKVAKNADRLRKEGDSGKGIIVSKENYILDGHHRWAAHVAVDSENNKFDSPMKVRRINIGIIDMLKKAEKFSGEHAGA